MKLPWFKSKGSPGPVAQPAEKATEVAMTVIQSNIALPAPVVTKMSPDVSSWLKGNDLDLDPRGVKMSDPYRQSTWVYVAVNVLAENVSQIPFRISEIPEKAQKQFKSWRKSSLPKCRHWCKQVQGENVLGSGAVVDLFEKPHPTMNRSLFWQSLMTWKALRGETFIVPLDGADQSVDLSIRGADRRLVKLLPLSPDFFWHIVRGYELEAWRFTGSPLMSPLASEIFLPGEVIHSRTVNPYTYWRGFSPMVLAHLPAASDFAAAMCAKGFMANNADSGLILYTDQVLGDEQMGQISAALKMRKRAAGTADLPLVLDSGLRVERPPVSSADNAFLEQRRYNREEIAAIMRIPVSLLGGTEHQKSSMGNSGGGQEQDKLLFIGSTIKGHCRELEASVEPIVKSFNPAYCGWFDIDDLELMQEARRNRVDAGSKVFGMGVSFNEINEVYDLGFSELPWGNVGYLPVNLIEAGTSQDPNQADPANPDKTDNPAEPIDAGFQRMIEALGVIAGGVTSNQSESKQAPEVHQCAASKEYAAAIAGSIKIKKGRLSKFFIEQRGRVLAKLGEVEKAFSGRRVAPDAVNKAIDDVFNLDDENSKLMARMKPLLIADLEFGGAQLWKEYGIGDFMLKPKSAIDFIAKRKNRIEGINDTTFEELKATLQEGLADGDSFKALADRIKAVFTTANDSRADTIAITETNTAVNSGRWEGLQTSGLELKAWLTSHLENTRDSHLAAEEDSLDGIPMDEPFSNGLMYPGDPDGPASEVINCRCHLIGIAGKSSADKALGGKCKGKLLRYEDWAVGKKY